MSLRTVSFQDTYWSGENDLIKEFYVPCMEESIEYCRAVGYFHSSIFCYITNGLYPFIQHGGRMRIVCSVNVSPEDEHQIALGYDIRQLLEDKIAPATQELIDLNIANIKELLKSLTQARFPEQVVVISTYDSAQGDYYMAKWKLAKTEQFAMICDEVHNMGAPKSQCLMELNPAYRIGLSATPRRNFDEIGSEKILDFYHQNTFEFSIKDAQREHYLVEYQYRILPCAMPEDDWELYKTFSREIVQLQHTLEQEDNEKEQLRLRQRIEGRYRDRAKLLKKNDQKAQTLQTIMNIDILNM